VEGYSACHQGHTKGFPCCLDVEGHPSTPDISDPGKPFYYFLIYFIIICFNIYYVIVYYYLLLFIILLFISTISS
jgi:hypothetical protein